MEFAADFTAIDFETASRRSDSACQLAAVVVRSGRVVDSAMWMIRPRPLYFSRSHIDIHGITPDRVRDEPEFGDLWPEIERKLDGDCLVAHNATFDLGVLLACLRSHGHAVPDIQFTCTRAIARRTWPNRRRFGLKPLSDWLGIRFQHHDALEDSQACAKVLMAAGIDGGAKDLSDLENKLGLSRGAAGEWGHRGPRRRTTSRRRSAANPHSRSTPSQPEIPGLSPRPAQDASSRDRGRGLAATGGAELDLQRLLVRAEFIQPLSGRSVVFTGRLRKLSRQQAVKLAQCSGGCCQESVNETTDLVVVGSGDATSSASGRKLSVKQQATEEYLAEGRQIRVLSEDEFLELVITK